MDFDGTIADSGEFAIRSLAKLSRRTVADQDLEKLRELSSEEVLRYFHLSGISLLRTLILGRRKFAQHLVHIKPVQGIFEAMEAIKAHNYKICVVSSNAKANIERFLALHQNQHLVDRIITSHSIFGKHHKITKAIKFFHATKEHTVYIGDETRDIDAARISGIKSIAVAWGYNNSTRLMQSQPNVCVENPADLLLALGSLL